MDALGDFASMFSLLQTWDTDGDGFVTSEEFQQGLQSLGFSVPQVRVCRELGVAPGERAGAAVSALVFLSRSLTRRNPPLAGGSRGPVSRIGDGQRRKHPNLKAAPAAPAGRRAA